MTEPKPKPGPKPKVPAEEDLRKVSKLAGMGCTLDQIAIALDVSSSTLDRWLKREDVRSAYEKGRITRLQKVTQRLFDLIEAGDTAATIFYLKCHGWNERPAEDATASAPAQVHVYLPDNGRMPDNEGG